MIAMRTTRQLTRRKKWPGGSASRVSLVLYLALVGSLAAQDAGPSAVLDRLPQLCAPTQVFASGMLEVYAVSPVRKVFAKDQPDAWGTVTRKDKIQLSLVRNETEPFFLVLRPAAELQNVTISFTWAPQPASRG